MSRYSLVAIDRISRENGLALVQLLDRVESLPKVLGYPWEGGTNNANRPIVFFDMLGQNITIPFQFCITQEVESRFPPTIQSDSAKRLTILCAGFRRSSEALLQTSGRKHVCGPWRLRSHQHRKRFFPHTNSLEPMECGREAGTSVIYERYPPSCIKGQWTSKMS